MELAGGSVAEGRQRLEHEREVQRAAVLSLDQIKAIRCSNEYTEGPSVVRGPPALPRTTPRPGAKQERTHEVVNVNNNYEHRPSGHAHGVGGQQYGGSRAPVLSRSTSTGSAASSGSNSSASSEQGLLARSPPSRPGGGLHQHHRAERPVRTQPKAPRGPHFLPLPPPLDAPLKPSGKADPSGVSAGGGHQFICERCGKCKCCECAAPRSLPARLACGGHCLCSAESALEHGTCMCLVKGVFYHCSGGDEDEGDSCADHPCSLSRSRCCARFLCMGLMSPLLPCLLCYAPGRALLRACQGCHDRLTRPGCRCKNSNTVYCRLEPWARGGPGKPPC